MRYPILLFDADGTLLDFNRDEYEALGKTLTAYHLPSDDHVKAKYHEINQSLWKRFERGQIGREEIAGTRFRELFCWLGVKCDDHAFNQDYIQALSEGGYPLQGALPLCKALKEKGHRLFFATNGSSATQYSRIEHAGFSPYFEQVFVSEDAGSPKPNKAFFDYMAARISGFSPADTLMIGDALSSDILGGQNAGIDTCWYNPLQEAADIATPPTYEIDRLDKLLSLLAE